MRFEHLKIEDFPAYLVRIAAKRKITHIQQHHTFSPSYATFKGNNHLRIQNGMRNFHMQQNGWQDIGQHFTTFPDGTIMTGRSIEIAPACIRGNNGGGICLEHVGCFDRLNGQKQPGDVMTQAHRHTIILASAMLCKHFNLNPENDVLYHHWFHLTTGRRNGGGGTRTNKTCPGNNFFGGNKYEDYKHNLMPLIQAEIDYFNGNGVWQTKQTIST